MLPIGTVDEEIPRQAGLHPCSETTELGTGYGWLVFDSQQDSRTRKPGTAHSNTNSTPCKEFVFECTSVPFVKGGVKIDHRGEILDRRNNLRFSQLRKQSPDHGLRRPERQHQLRGRRLRDDVV